MENVRKKNLQSVKKLLGATHGAAIQQSSFSFFEEHRTHGQRATHTHTHGVIVIHTYELRLIEPQYFAMNLLHAFVQPIGPLQEQADQDS